MGRRRVKRGCMPGREVMMLHTMQCIMQARETVAQARLYFPESLMRS